jgi:hypothetical protein
MQAKQMRIVSDGLARTTKIYDVATGEDITSLLRVHRPRYCGYTESCLICKTSPRRRSCHVMRQQLIVSARYGSKRSAPWSTTRMILTRSIRLSRSCLSGARCWRLDDRRQPQRRACGIRGITRTSTDCCREHQPRPACNARRHKPDRRSEQQRDRAGRQRRDRVQHIRRRLDTCVLHRCLHLCLGDKRC